MLGALALVAIVASVGHATILPTTSHMHVVGGPSELAASKQVIGPDGVTCNEYYTHLKLLEEFENLASVRTYKGKTTMSKEDAANLKVVVKALKKKTQLRDQKGNLRDYHCWTKSAKKSFYNSVLPEFDALGDVPIPTEEELNLLKRPTRPTRGDSTSLIDSTLFAARDSTAVALANTAERITPCSTYANCPYADCFACFYGWYLGGSSKTEFEVCAYNYVYNATWYASQNQSPPFPDSPVEFMHQECKVTHFKYHSLPEPTNLVPIDLGPSCKQALACDDWITQYTYANNIIDDFTDATHCLCTYTPYIGKIINSKTFASVCVPSLSAWAGYNVMNF
mmetsp:Transcript_23335/g.61862  ORF Transcript_23335/g.61862 Transcript_23335/m.61862 type:complete len:338 (-) Transcript_23335:73-1086(-)